MTVGTLFLIGIGIVAILAILIVLDFLFAGGAGAMGMMHGTVMMASNPIGQAILLVLIAILGVLVYAVFFR